MPFHEDVKIALRRIRRAPGFSVSVAIVLAIATAGTTMGISVVNGLFWHPLPFRDAERLVDLDETSREVTLESIIAYPHFYAWRARSQSIEAMGVWAIGDFNLVSERDAEHVDVARVTHDVLGVFGLRPQIGRAFTPEDDRPGAAKVALLGHDLWRRRFAGRVTVLSTWIELNGEPYVVVGVLPRKAVLPAGVDLWIPLAARPDERYGGYLRGVGRLRPGHTVEHAQAELAAIHRTLPEVRPGYFESVPQVVPLRARYVGRYRDAAALVFGGVLLALLVACLNVAALLMARHLSRTSEVSLRLALGARPWQVITPLVGEGTVLVMIGGLLGFWLGRLGAIGLREALARQLPDWVAFRPGAPGVGLSLTLLGASVAVAGLWPALHSARTVRADAGREGRANSRAMNKGHGLDALVMGQIAVSLVVLSVAMILWQTLRQVVRVDLGFRPEHVLTYQISFPARTYPEAHRRSAFVDQLLDETRALPGVRAAGAVVGAPLGPSSTTFVEAEQAGSERRDERGEAVLTRMATPGYFTAMGVRLVRGRLFTEADADPQAVRVVVLDESLAARLWPNENPIGRRIRWRDRNDPWMTVVGIAGDVRHDGPETAVRPGLYLPYAQAPMVWVTVVLRSDVAPQSVVGSSRDIATRLDPAIPIYDVKTLTERVNQVLWIRRGTSYLALLVAGVTLMLTLVGVYSLMCYRVRLRQREIAIRFAMGGRPRQIVGRMLRDAALLGVCGLALGSLGAIWAAGALRRTFPDVGSLNLTTLAAAACFITAAVVLASLPPGLRAARTNPLEVLRAE